jgi:hypothetical protein
MGENMVLLSIFGLVDVLLGGVLAASPFFSYAGMAVISALAAIAVVKGLYSVATAAFSSFYFDMLGWLDLIVGALLFLTVFGVHFPWFLWIGVFMAAKGVYSIGVELIGD